VDIAIVIRQACYRWARQEAEDPVVRDPLLDASRVIVLAQRLAAEQVNGPREADSV
jgi:hypothetical protein